jgi:ADP-ribose pyrophosphatase YjhB (NUDIX family)
VDVDAQPPIVIRAAARILVYGPDERVLLFRARRRNWPTVWVPPGGRVEPGERIEQAARRELMEETGLRVAALAAPVACTREMHVRRTAIYDCREHVFVVRVRSETIDTSGFTEREQSMLDTHRWWSIDELERSDEPFYPADVPRLAAALRRATESPMVNPR